jgi:hypothetical protein
MELLRTATLRRGLGFLIVATPAQEGSAVFDE